MKIHCFYNDIILSLRQFFDRVIFPEGYIKGYQFNIGNRSVQINYSGNFELPSMIINYVQSKPMFYHPFTFQKTPVGRNNNTYPVLYDRTKRLSLLLHEELFQFTVEAHINCESQLSALEIEHILQTRMVVNKYFHQYKFYSFLEIDKSFLNENMFDVNNDEITNLFMKYNHLDNTTNYCFSIQYEPLIRLDSVDTQLGSTEQRSFQINLPLTIINPIPIYLEIPFEERPKHHIKTKRLANDIVISTGEFPILEISIQEEQNGPLYVGIDKLNGISILDINNDIQSRIFKSIFRFTKSKSGDEFTGLINGKIIGIYRLGSAEILIDRMTVTCFVIIHSLYGNNINVVEISNPLTGQIYDAILTSLNETDNEPTYNNSHAIEPNNFRISGLFNGVLHGKSIRTNISFDFITESQYYDIDIFDIVVNQPIYKSFAKIVPVANIHESIKSFNSYIMSVIPEQIEIKKIILSCDIEDASIELYSSEKCFCDKRGNFIFSFPFEHPEDGLIDANITGNIDPKTLRFFSTTSGPGMLYYCNNDKIADILGFVIDVNFESTPGFGARFIDSININILDTDQPISTGIVTTKSVAYDTPINRKIIRNYIIDSNCISNFFVETDNFYILKLVLDVAFNYDKLVQQNVKLGWSFNIDLLRGPLNTYVFENGNSDIKLNDRDGSLPGYILEFTCTKKVYNSIFRMIQIDNPVYFQLFELKVKNYDL